jgi:gluconate 5-dehydrogenase
MNRFRVDGKLALITGATRGIGLGAARALALAGADVILVGRNRFELEHAADELRQIARHVHVAPYDLSDTSGIEEWFNCLCTTVGTPEILVNSAGIQKRGAAIDLSLDDWHSVMTLNATAVFELSRTFARHLIGEKRTGRIINIASLMTAAARPGTSPYTASKGAVGQLTKALAVEWAQNGILVNAIAPGYIDTELNKSDLGPDIRQLGEEPMPAGTLGNPGGHCLADRLSRQPSSEFHHWTGDLCGRRLAGDILA